MYPARKMTYFQGQALPSDAPVPLTTSAQAPLPSLPMRRRARTSATTDSSRPNSRFVPVSVYSHVSTYRSSILELQLYSPSLKVHHSDTRGPIAVFSQHDQIDGKVSLDPSGCQSGRLSVVIEGSFSYQPPRNWDKPIPSRLPKPQRYVFLASRTIIGVTNAESSSSKSTFRDAFVRRRPSISDATYTSSSTEKSHPFAFQLPQSIRPGEELPPTFVSKNDPSSSDYFDVTYKIVADWEPNDPTEVPSHLEVPFLIHPDAGFQCIDASAPEPDSWLEMPLKAERPILVRCAITLPTSVTFARTSSIPYFVVFTTTPRSPELAKEIAADATICVSLVRQIVITNQTSLPPTPPLTPSSDESEFSTRTRLLRRVGKSQPRLRRTSEGSISITREKPLPEIPAIAKSYSDTRTIMNDMCIGFPKRPRQQSSKTSHPSLESIASIPDGLHKARIQLSKDMLPCIDWAGVSVKYYLDVSVLLGPDELRARIPIRIF
ncbi:hypothetical protein M413DRAFT_268498 [Hebeloma cylindrosporum]|uniref:Uncharacterized protein n=1 Tax=Hebeloma cylindrosporum TaxID=76867 RepID=A0A0C2YB49_HEBCY|nr:hypothetical protein M413DRAFT_268498 [Hebeloma cylindrosporum h7]